MILPGRNKALAECKACGKNFETSRTKPAPICRDCWLEVSDRTRDEVTQAFRKCGPSTTVNSPEAMRLAIATVAAVKEAQTAARYAALRQQGRRVIEKQRAKKQGN